MFKYYLESTGDCTDRTAEITEMLKKYSVCRLGAGEFYVQNLVMPDDTSIFGEGAATKVILNPEVKTGFAIRLQSRCSVKDFKLLGSLSDITPQENLGERHGLVWYGDYTATYQTEKAIFPVYGTVSNLYIRGFSGGGITHNDTGFSTLAGINVTNCCIENCGAGINIDYWSEFNRYTNVSSNKNYYGLINNGGNNVFVNCGFSSNVCGVLMDNSDGTKRNNSHGDMLGCTIDHSDKNEGIGIKIVNMNVGYHFIGCQVMYSKIDITDSSGLTFQNINFKNDEVTVRGGGVIIFSNCIAKDKLTFNISNNENVKVIDCYTRDGSKKITL